MFLNVILLPVMHRKKSVKLLHMLCACYVRLFSIFQLNQAAHFKYENTSAKTTAAAIPPHSRCCCFLDRRKKKPQAIDCCLHKKSAIKYIDYSTTIIDFCGFFQKLPKRVRCFPQTEPARPAASPRLGLSLRGEAPTQGPERLVTHGRFLSRAVGVSP